MTLEDQRTERKYLRTVTGRTADWDNLARASARFAYGPGHHLYCKFRRIHKSMYVAPAMEAGIADYVWILEEIAGLAR